MATKNTVNKKKIKREPLKAKSTLTIGKSVLNINSVTALKYIFWVLRNPMKLKIIETIYQAKEKGILVKDIQDKINLNQSHTSIHLRELRKINLVDSARDGRFVVYKIQTETFDRIKKVIDFSTEMGIIPLKKI